MAFYGVNRQQIAKRATLDRLPAVFPPSDRTLAVTQSDSTATSRHYKIEKT
ncbi:hypothetical protein [Synechococcus sp. PCC 7336]|uniref:hypothetical protein n=1 Tax=Synechococcus sp. PCC 7336 TaxID=195250 RepID=UPI00037C310C|nr:hypothetical protein [Synechococcus sp. PCC 7336]